MVLLVPAKLNLKILAEDDLKTTKTMLLFTAGFHCQFGLQGICRIK